MERAPHFPTTTESDVTPEYAGEQEHTYEILHNPELRVKYLHLTDELVSKIVEQKTDVAIFLDKSARPVAWMVNELWDLLAPQQTASGEVIKKPEIKFLNIDREQWGALMGRSEDNEGTINVDRIPHERIEELRELYAPISDQSAESLLTDKNVLVIDEVKMSGDTLEMAQKIIHRAFPDANEVKGTYWMQGKVQRDAQSGARVGTEVPIWYSDTVITGRLVGNRDTTKSMASNSSRQRVGRYWLSTPFREPDLEGRQLKREVKWMAEDLRNHELLYVPSTQWDEGIESIEHRIERINGMTIEDYIEHRKHIA